MGKLFNLDSPIMRGLSKITDLLWLNILAVICCIPIVTAGASITALYYVSLKMVKNEEGYLTQSFFKAFKNNFKKATVIWLILLSIILIIVADFWILMNLAPNSYIQYIRFPLIVLAVYVILVSFYVFPLQAQFENTIRGTLKNAVLLTVSQFHYTIGFTLLHAFPVLLFVVFSNAILLLVTLFGLSGVVYIASIGHTNIYKKIFKHIEAAQVNEENPEDDIE